MAEAMLRTLPSVGVTASVLAVLTAGPALAQVADLQVYPESVTLAVGERKEVLAVAYDRGGNVVTEVQFNWAESDAGIVRVDIDRAAPPGVAYLIGVGAGMARVTVTVGPRQQHFSVTVAGNPVGGAQGTGVATILRLEPQPLYLFPLEDVQLRAVFLKDDGSPAAYSPLTWRSFRDEVAQVDQNGKVVGIQPGPGVIEATSQSGLQARIQVQVASTEWAFAAPSLGLSPLLSDTIRVIVPSQSNRRVDGRWFQWRPADPNIASVSPLGVVTAISAGHTDVVATGFGQEMRIPVSVHREVVGLNILPSRQDTVIVPLGGTRRFIALPVASDETVIPDAPVHWVPGDTTVLGYDLRDSLALGRKIGVTTLTAKAASNWEAAWTVRVVAAGLVLDGERLGMSLPDRISLRASFADSSGAPLSPATDVTWTSNNPDVLQVDERGTLVPIARGRAQVVAGTPWGVADTATVFVQGEILVTSTRLGSADLYAFDRGDPSAFTPITAGAGDDIGPVYSPDGSQVAFASNRDGNFEIYVMDADGVNPLRVTQTTANETEPAWTPDGRQLLYQADASGTLQVWIMNADGSNQRPLTEGPPNHEPVVSPDGSTVAFTSVRDGNYEIFLMNLDGSNQRNLTQTASLHERAPAWLGNGTVLYVLEERMGRTATRIVARQELSGGVLPLTEPTLLVTDFAVAPAGDVLAVTAESPGPSGGVARRLFMIPLDGESAFEVPRAGEHDQLVRPAFRP